MGGDLLRWSAMYGDYLRGLDLSEKTVATYRQKVDRCVDWCRRNRRDLRRLSATDMRRMADECFPFTHSTRRQLRSAVTRFLDLSGSDPAPAKAIRVPKKPRGRNRALDQSQAKALVKTSHGWFPEGLAVLAGLYLGLRASEIGAMQWSRYAADWYTVLGKHGVTRSIPVHPVLADELAHVRRCGDWLFRGSRGRDHVSGVTVLNWTKRVCVEADLPEVTTHRLRHTAITEVYERTGDAFVAQEFAGHARIETTRLYSRVASERLIAGVASMNYLD